MSEKLTTRDARRLVQARKEFHLANLFGIPHNDRCYAVYSYGTHWPLFACIDDAWYANVNKYSVTTSKHYGQVHPQVAVTEVSCAELQALIRNTMKG